MRIPKRSQELQHLLYGHRRVGLFVEEAVTHAVLDCQVAVHMICLRALLKHAQYGSMEKCVVGAGLDQHGRNIA